MAKKQQFKRFKRGYQPRNYVALDLHTNPLYKPKQVTSKKTYTRKVKHKGRQNDS